MFLYSLILFNILYFKNSINDKQNGKQETKYHTVGKVTIFNRGRRGRDRMIVGFTFTYAISAYHH